MVRWRHDPEKGIASQTRALELALDAVLAEALTMEQTGELLPALSWDTDAGSACMHRLEQAIIQSRCRANPPSRAQANKT